MFPGHVLSFVPLNTPYSQSCKTALKPKALYVTSLSLTSLASLAASREICGCGKRKWCGSSLTEVPHQIPLLAAQALILPVLRCLLLSSCCFSRDSTKAQVKEADRARKLKELPQTPAAVCLLQEAEKAKLTEEPKLSFVLDLLSPTPKVQIEYICFQTV